MTFKGHKSPKELSAFVWDMLRHIPVEWPVDVLYAARRCCQVDFRTNTAFWLLVDQGLLTNTGVMTPICLDALKQLDKVDREYVTRYTPSQLQRPPPDTYHRSERQRTSPDTYRQSTSVAQSRTQSMSGLVDRLPKRNEIDAGRLHTF
eukprot:Lankesteria_metandrocarpae@DN5231_c0_g1_i3.p1